MLNSMGPILMVNSVDDTVKYYAKVLGFELVMSKPTERYLR